MDEEYNLWNIVKKDTNKKPANLFIREGEIRWCRIGKNIGNESVGKGDFFKRPVLILKKFSKDVFLGIPLTTKEKTGNWFYKIKNENIQNTAILNQARLLDKKRLENKIYEISESELRNIKLIYCLLILKDL